MTTSSASIRPLFIFGISGGTWDVADELIAAGGLEALRSLQARGSSLTLRSSRVDDDEHYRPLPAWATLLTGVEPFRHGITRFYHTARELIVEPLWSAYTSRGLRVGLYGCPLSWPPQPLAGYVVPSHLARDEQTWPPDLRTIKRLDRRAQELEREPQSSRRLGTFRDAVALWRLGVGAPTFARLASGGVRSRIAGDPEIRALLLRRAKLDLGVQLFLSLQRRFAPQFTMFTTFFVDFVSHRYWRYFEPERFGEARPGDGRLAAAVPAAYESVDRALARLLETVPEEAVIAVVSEHGMEAEPESGELGRWRYLLRGSRIAALIGLGEELRARPVARWLAFEARAARRLPVDLVSRLREITVTATRRPLFDVYDHGDEVVVKLAVRAQDAPLVRGDLGGLSISYGNEVLPFNAIAVRAGATRSAMHARDGLMVLAGPGIRGFERVAEPAELLDFGPTILTAAGLPVPAYMHGRVLDVFA